MSLTGGLTLSLTKAQSFVLDHFREASESDLVFTAGLVERVMVYQTHEGFTTGPRAPLENLNAIYSNKNLN